MKKFGWTIAFICLAFSLFAGNTIDISSQIEAEIEIEPGDARTIPISVTNNSGKDMVLIPKIQLPEGADIILGNSQFELEDGQKDLQLIKFIIPQELSAGQYDFRYDLKTEGDFQLLATIERKLIIPEISEIEVECLSEMNSVLAGDDYLIKYVIFNRSNIVNTIDISIDVSNFISYKIDRDTYTLSPGDAREISIIVQTKKRLSNLRIANVKLTAKTENQKSKNHTTLKILPIKNPKTSLYRSIPANIALSAGAELDRDTTYFFHPEFYLNGPIDKKGRINLEMLYKSHRISKKYGEESFTENISDELFAIGNEYRMSLVLDNFNVQFGDYNSQITELFYTQRLRGISGHLNISGFNLTTQYQEPSWSPTGDKYLMGKIGYKKDAFSFDVGYLSFDEDTTSDKVIWISSRFQPINGTKVALEYAYNNNISNLPDYDSKAPNAILAKLNSKYKAGSIDISYIFAGSDYTDRFNSKDLFRASGNLNIYKSLKLNASASNIEYNISRDTTINNAYRERRYSGALRFKLHKSNEMQIQGNKRKRIELIYDENSEFEEQTIGMLASQRLKKLTMDLSLAYGKNMNYSDHLYNENIIQRGRLSLDWRVSFNSNLQTYIRYYNNDLFYTNRGRCYVTGFSFKFEFNNLFYLRPGFDYEANLTETYDSEFSRYIGHGTMSLNLGKKQRLLIDAEYSSENGIETDQIRVDLKYIQKFGFPVGFSGKNSHVKGKVTYQNTEEPVEDVVLILGEYTTITGKNGKYEFKGIPQGDYNLIVKTTRLEKGKIPLQGSSVAIATKPGEIYVQNIAITDAAALSGKVNQMKYKDRSLASKDTTLVDEGGISGIMVEIRQGPKVQRQYTDKDGKFKFDNVQPGNWEVSFYAKNLPAKTYLERESIIVQTVSNEEKTVTNRVLPSKKQIKIMQDGRTLKPKRK